ncbi:MAG: hypothetical protein J0L60_01840 [Ignavibacteria bacterium]|nr:hypothetical protein [Ignavibacteria bacterium]
MRKTRLTLRQLARKVLLRGIKKYFREERDAQTYEEKVKNAIEKGPYKYANPADKLPL